MDATHATIELVTIGTELLLGFTVDTNSAFIGRTLATVGVRVARRTVGQRRPRRRSATPSTPRSTRTGAVITTGGLGPTRDDISKHVVAELLGMPLEFDAARLAMNSCERLDIDSVAKLADSNRSQAMVPAGGTVLPNSGAAPRASGSTRRAAW